MSSSSSGSFRGPVNADGRKDGTAASAALHDQTGGAPRHKAWVTAFWEQRVRMTMGVMNG